MKYAAGITFNENTDLIIEADPTGEVTSCRNIINGVEYVGGGGGSSDFSTAEVTFINSLQGSVYGVAELVQLTDSGMIISSDENNIHAVNYGENVVITFPLYKGAFIANPELIFYRIGIETMPITTGNIELSEAGIIITGNGTFTAEGQIPG